MAAAAARFREPGFEKATTGEIARAAGVAEGTLFLHFGSKLGLLVEVMQSYYDSLVEVLAVEAARKASAEARLRHLARFWLERIRGDWSLMRVFGHYGRFSEDPEIRDRFAGMNRQVTRLFAALFEDLKAEGRIPDSLPTFIVRDTFFGAAEHLLLGIENTGRERDLAEAADHLCDLLLGAPSSAKVSPPAEPTLSSLDAKLDRLLAVAEGGD